MKGVKLFFAAALISGAVFNSCATVRPQEAVIELNGNPTTGYTWEYEIEDDDIIEVDEEVLYLGKNDVVGAPSKFKYTLHSLKAGNTKIKFEYKRPWEQKAADKVVVYEVIVNQDGMLELKEANGEVDADKEGLAGENKDISFRSVSMDEGLSLMEADDSYILLDVRLEVEFESGHIPGALQLTNETMTEEKALALLPDKNQTIYVYCRSGHRSKLASKKLIGYGYKDVVDIGGILDYSGRIEK